MKEKLKKPLINPWRLSYARYGQDFSSASFLEQEHAAVFAAALSGDSPVPRGGSKAFSKAFFFFGGEERVGSREAPLVSQGSEETRSPLRHFPDQRRLLEAPTCWEETFRVQGQVCLSSIPTDTNCYAIFRKSLLSDSIQFIRLRAWKNKYWCWMESAGTNQTDARVCTKPVNRVSLISTSR